VPAIPGELAAAQIDDPDTVAERLLEADLGAVPGFRGRTRGMREQFRSLA